LISLYIISVNYLPIFFPATDISAYTHSIRGQQNQDKIVNFLKEKNHHKKEDIFENISTVDKTRKRTFG
jgi:hypothetical protein